MWRRQPAPDLSEFEVMARAAFEALPEPFRALSRDVVLRVDDFAPPDVLASLGIADGYGLLGLYQGVDRTRRSVHDSGTLPDMVWLYRMPILNTWRQGRNSLEEIVRHVLVHEIGHHFGLSDDDMYGLEDESYDEERHRN